MVRLSAIIPGPAELRSTCRHTTACSEMPRAERPDIVLARGVQHGGPNWAAAPATAPTSSATKNTTPQPAEHALARRNVAGGGNTRQAMAKVKTSTMATMNAGTAAPTMETTCTTRSVALPRRPRPLRGAR